MQKCSQVTNKYADSWPEDFGSVSFRIVYRYYMSNMFPYCFEEGVFPEYLA